MVASVAVSVVIVMRQASRSNSGCISFSRASRRICSSSSFVVIVVALVIGVIVIVVVNFVVAI